MHADRDTGAEADDLGGRALRDELDAVEEDAVVDVVAAELTGHDIPWPALPANSGFATRPPNVRRV